MKLLIYLAFAGAMLHAQTTVTISDTIKTPMGGNWSGTVQVTLNNPATAQPLYAGSETLSGWSQTVTVTNGAFSITLYPNDAITPTGTSYTARYSPTSGAGWSETWVVPTGATTIRELRSTTVPTPRTMFTPSQITQDGAALNNVLRWNGSRWAPFASILTDPMTTTGDMIFRTGGVPSRLPIGSTGQLLTVSSGAPAWTTLASTGLSDSAVLVRGAAALTTANRQVLVSSTGTVTQGAIAETSGSAAPTGACTTGARYTQTGRVPVQYSCSVDSVWVPGVSRPPKSDAGIAANSNRLIVLCCDSLTDGAGSSTFRTTLEAEARARHGFGGAGYWGFAFYGAAPVFTKSAGVQYTSINDGIYGQFSPDGRGVYVASGGGSDNFSFTVGSYYDNARMYYLVQSGGGSFTVNTPGGNTTISTSGTLGIASVNLPYGTGTISVTAITGNVMIFGALFTMNNNAPIFGNFAVGGRTLQQVAAQDSTFRRAWMTALSPALYILNAGMNDRSTRTPAQHNTDLTTIVSDIQTASAATGVVIVQSPEPSDAVASNFNGYVAEKVAVAKARNVGYLDLRSIFGSYTQANTDGLMFDAVHPSALGNQLIGTEIARFIGAHSTGADPGPTTAVPQFRTGTLPTQTFQIAAATARTVYTLGLTTGFPQALVTIRVTANRNGTGAAQAKEHNFLINGSSASNGTAASVSAITTRTIFTENAGDFQTIDWTPTVSVVSGRAVLVFTTNSFIGNFVVEGSWVTTIAGPSGNQQVYTY